MVVAPSRTRTEILQAKLRPPPGKSETVVRVRLLARLAAAREASVVAVTAPLGYGKSTLLRQASEADERPAAWLTLDRRDDDPLVLISHLVAALELVGGTSHSLAEAMSAPGASIWTHLMPRLTVALGELGPVVVILDDVHEVGSIESTDVLTWLALHVPDGSRFILAGRHPIDLPLARLRLDGRLLELGRRDLALTDDEAVEVVGLTWGDVDAPAAIALNRRCEGWAAALQLAVMARAENEHPLGPTALGSDQGLREYVRAEVLTRLSDRHVRFLLQTSVLRSLSAALCDSILETAGSGEILGELERSNALVEALDDARTWYRYHDLFRGALLAELERIEPGRSATLRRRAADWHASDGLPEEAVRYMQESGDPVAATSLIGRFAQSLYNGERNATVLSWLDWVEEEGLLGADPRLPMLGALGLALLGEAERSARWSRVLDRMDWEGSLPDGSRDIDAWRALARSLLGPGDASEALAAAIRASELIAGDSSWRCLALVSLGNAWWMNGDTDKAAAALNEAVDLAGVGPAQPNALSVAHAMLARLALSAGDAHSARAQVARADAIRVRHGLGEQAPQAFVDAIAARLAIADGRRDESLRRIGHAQRLRPLLTWAMPSLAVMTRLELAHAHLALADPAGARTVALEIGDILHHRPGLGTLETEAAELRRRLAAIRGGVVSASSLTTAELRLMPMLATHLSFHEIGERLFVSTNTVKTQAMSIYRKLDATSRSEAVEHAVRVGLLDPAAVTAILTRARGFA